MLVVETPRAGFDIVKVVRADETPDIDVDADFDYKWAVQKIDLTEYNNRREREANFKSTMRDIERVKQRESLVDDFRKHLNEASEARKMFDAAVNALMEPIEGVSTPAVEPEEG